MNFPIWPPAASEYAGQVDWLFAFITAIVTLLSVPVFLLLILFAVRYRQGRVINRRPRQNRNVWLETSWAVIPLALSMIFFVWAARLYFDAYRPPEDALDIDVVAKQWMWKAYHPGGAAEINELHVPKDTPVRIRLISQDVIHSLYFPALRIKRDALPGRTTTMWFEADRIGRYHLLCTEFCGTAHSEMRGRIVVIERSDYEAWLERAPADLSLAARGAQHYRSFGCSGCHEDSDVVRAPPLEGVYGSPVPLMSGAVIVADEGYIRDSILLPKKAIVAGYRPVMPSFQDRITEQQLIELVAYIKSLAVEEEYRR